MLNRTGAVQLRYVRVGLLLACIVNTASPSISLATSSCVIAFPCTIAIATAPDGTNDQEAGITFALASASGTKDDGTTGLAEAQAHYGSLHATAISQSQSPAHSVVFASGGSRAGATFNDIITPVSNVLAPGTPVSLSFRMFGDGLLDRSGNPLEAEASVLSQLFVNNSKLLEVASDTTMFQGPVSFNQSADFTGFIGAAITIQGGLSVEGRSSTLANCVLSNNCSLSDPDNFYSYLNSTGIAAFYDTSNFQITSNTAGASLISASGATYTGIETPEPSTFVLLAIGLLGLAGRHLPRRILAA